MRDTIEELALSRRGRGNIISSCYDSKWDLPDIERDEGYLGEIYRRTMRMPLDIRKRDFDWSKEVYAIMSRYCLKKAKEAVSAISPKVPIRNVGKVLIEAHNIIRFTPQSEPELEDKRKQFVFALAVNAFLRHL